MDRVVFYPLFQLVSAPDVRLRRLSWLSSPSSGQTLCFILLSYFLVTGGIIYDVIVEPPSMGSTTDERGHSRPVAFLPYRINGQYIMEGLAASFMFTLGALGLIVLDQTHARQLPKLNRSLLQLIGFGALIIAFACCSLFMRMKLPGYMHS